MSATTLGPPAPTPAHPHSHLARHAGGTRGETHDDGPSLSQPLVALVTVALAVAAYLAMEREPSWQAPTLKGFVVLVLTLLPGLLYLRFLRMRLQPLREEYLYNLHRLRLDSPQFLPEPPTASKFHERWVLAGGEAFGDVHTIYEQKFSTQYGIRRDTGLLRSFVGLGNAVSVLVCTAALGVGLAAVIWYPPIDADVTPLHAMLGFGFLGAYFFVLSVLTRRYFQNDLRPGAYLMAVVRIVTVLLLVAALTPLSDEGPLSTGTLDVVAFSVGIFPTVALQLMRRTVGRATGWARGGLEPPFPLGQLDGIDIWTEARLLEVGIEDVQHLATANLVDVSLATRIPMQRMVDWVDQGLLVLHTRLPRSGDEEDPKSLHSQLRGLGVRSASDLALLVETLGLDLGRRRSWPGVDDPALGALVAVDDVTPAGGGLLTRAAVIALLVSKEPNFTLVRNWQRDGDEPAPALILPAAQRRGTVSTPRGETRA